MIVYRFANAKYSKDLSGEGSKLFGGRWNNKGTAILYTSTSISLALLELLIHSASYDEILTNQLVIIDTHLDEIKVLKKYVGLIQKLMNLIKSGELGVFTWRIS